MGVGLGAAGALLLLDHALIGGQTGLGLGLTGLGAGADPFQLASQGALAGFGFGVLLNHPLLLGLEPAGVVALVGVALAAVQLQRPLGDEVEEVAIVGHQDDAAGEVLNSAFLYGLHATLYSLSGFFNSLFYSYFYRSVFRSCCYKEKIELQI